MAKLIRMKSAIIQIQEKLKELILVIHQFNLLLQERTKMTKRGHIEMIRAASTFVSDYVPFLMVKHHSSTKEPRIALVKKFDGIRLQF